MSETGNVLKRSASDCAPIIAAHGPILAMLCDNATVNVFQNVVQWFLGNKIQRQTSSPYEAHQNGCTKRAVGSVTTGARTVMSATGVGGGVWAHAIQYAAFIHNVAHSPRLGTSPHVLMKGSKPDLSDHHAFGSECWMYPREGLQSDRKFNPRGDQCLCLGYSENQQGYSVLNISLTLHTVMHTTNVVFTDQFPLAKSFPTEIMSKANDLNLSNPPDELAIENLNEQCIASVARTHNGKLVIEVH